MNRHVKWSLLLIPLCGMATVRAQDNKKPAAPPGLAAPLRKFDRNRDGTLSDEELKLARQAHNRGGREAEPTERKWRDLLDRQEKEFVRQREKEFDLNGDGKIDSAERREMQAVWKRIATKYTELRHSLTAKYDRNDDGELNEQERNASRAESDRLRRESADQIVREWKASHPKKPAT